MNSTRLFLAEDEPFVRKDLAEVLIGLGYEVVASAATVNESLAKLEKLETDLCLLDISLEGKLDGIDLAHRINSLYSLPFIYLTAFYDSNTLERARLTMPAGYIVKPWNEDNLKANIELALNKPKNQVERNQMLPDVFYIHSKQQYLPLPIDTIQYVQSDDNYSRIVTTEAEHVISQTLKRVAERLNNAGFQRIHRSYLVNIHHIESISGNTLYLKGCEVPIGRNYKQELLNRLNIL